MAVTDFEDAAVESVETLSEALSGMADRLYEFAESLLAGEEEVAALNEGMTEAEVEAEDAQAAQIAAPIVEALDGLSGIINSAIAELLSKTGQAVNDL